MFWKRLPVTLGVVLALALSAGPAAAASPAASSPVTVVPAGCDFQDSSGDAVASFDPRQNKSQGFVAFGGGTCGQPAFSGTLHYFEGHDRTWRHTPSPYAGLVLAVTDDATGTYVLFANSTGIYVGKRIRPSATFQDPVRLSGNGTSGAALPQGDIVALAGGYWAVWTEQVGPGGEFAQADLFQAKTLGAGDCIDAVPRTRLTTHSRDDADPSLVLLPETAGRSGAHLTWSRNDGARGESGWLMYSRAGCEARWSPFQTLFRAGNSLDPDMTRANRTDYLAWDRNSRLVEAEVSPGPFRAKAFPRPFAANAHITVPRNVVAVVFQSQERLASMERRRGVWSLRWLTSPGLQQQAISATSFGSTFTAWGVSHRTDRLYAITVR